MGILSLKMRLLLKFRSCRNDTPSNTNGLQCKSVATKKYLPHILMLSEKNFLDPLGIANKTFKYFT